MRKIKIIGYLLIVGLITSSCKDRYAVEEDLGLQFELKNDYCETNINKPVIVSFLSNDVIGDDYTLTIHDPSMGKIELFQGKNYAKYTPNADAFGNDKFYYTVCSGENCYNAMISVQIMLVSECDKRFMAQADNIYPAVNESYKTSISRLTENDNTCILDEVDNTYFKIVTQPEHGQVTFDISKNQFVYTPENGFEGVDALEYEVISHNNGDVRSRAEVKIGVGQDGFITD